MTNMGFGLGNELRNICETALDNAPIGMTLSSLDGHFLRVNRSLCNIFGYEAEELVGKHYSEISHPEDLKANAQRAQDFMDGVSNSYRVEKRYMHKSGHPVWCRVSVSSISDESGKRLYFVAQMEDITEQKTLEQSLRRASAAKSEFLSRMSHELRTPMNAILGFSQLLHADAERLPDSETRERVELILKASLHLTALINEVLDLSSVEAGKLAVERKLVDPRPVVEECLQFVEQSAAQRQVCVELSAEKEPIRVYGDSLRIRQVMLNLLSNAIKYNRVEGKVIVSLKSGVRGVRFSVSDTGLGIPQTQIQELFKPFSRLSVNRKEAEGTGVGLALCKRLVEAMDGELGVESIFGKGSTFWFDLPAGA